MLPLRLGMIPRSGRGLFGVWVFHLDDSGEKREPVVTLAGYLGAVEDWARFEEEARHHLDEFSITHLHTVDLHHLRGEFKGWDRGRTFAFAQQLFAILGRHVPIGLEFSVLKEPYEERRKTLNVAREGAATTFCFKGLLHQILNNAAVRNSFCRDDVSLSFVVEAGNRHNNAILNEFNRIKRYNPKLRSLIFEDKKALIALQAADFFAYFSRRIRCMGDAKNRAAEWDFYMDATAGVTIHSQFLATNFFADPPVSGTRRRPLPG